jgi:hypothetical protein
MIVVVRGNNLSLNKGWDPTNAREAPVPNLLVRDASGPIFATLARKGSWFSI